MKGEKDVDPGKQLMDNEVMLTEKPEPRNPPRKRCSVNMKEQHDVQFVHRSKRLNKNLGGFSDEASAAAAAAEGTQEDAQALVLYK